MINAHKGGEGAMMGLGWPPSEPKIKRTEALHDEVIERVEGPGLGQVLQEAPKVLLVLSCVYVRVGW